MLFFSESCSWPLPDHSPSSSGARAPKSASSKIRANVYVLFHSLRFLRRFVGRELGVAFRRYTERWIHTSSVFVFRRDSSSCNAPTPTQSRSDIPAVAIKSWLCCSTSRLFQCFQVYMHENFIFSVCFFLRSRTKRFRRCFVLLFSISLPSRGIDDNRRVSNNNQQNNCEI